MQPLSTLSNVYFVCVQINDRQSLCENTQLTLIKFTNEKLDAIRAHTEHCLAGNASVYRNQKENLFHTLSHMFRFQSANSVNASFFIDIQMSCQTQQETSQSNKMYRYSNGPLKTRISLSLNLRSLSLARSCYERLRYDNYPPVDYLLSCSRDLILSFSLFLFSLFHSLPLHHNKKKCHRHVLKHLKR